MRHKNKNRKKITLLNTISAFVLQLALIINNFIIPKLILSYFGSETNGLISSVTQFLNYITLLEGGLSGVVAAALYGPLVRKDSSKINAIVAATKKFYKKIGYIFAVYSIFLAIIYPIVTKTPFSYQYVSSIIVILSITMIFQYMLSLTYKTLLTADKKAYIVSFTQAFLKITEILLAFICVKVYPDIHILKIITGALFISQPIIYSKYAKNKYSLHKEHAVDESLLSSRWDGFSMNLAAFIHNVTDTTMLTIFTNLSTVSVYSVYALVSSGLKSIINSTVSSLNPTLGQTYAKGDIEGLKKKMDVYEYIVFVLVSLLFSVAVLLIVPFVMIYTRNINDTNYNQPIFATLLLISEAIYLIKLPHSNLAYSANKFKDVALSGYIEAGINVALSLILTPMLGLVGASIGTIVAMTYRMAYHVWFTTTLIRGRRQSIFYKKTIIFSSASIIGIIICKTIFPLSDTATTLNWIMHALIYILTIGIVLLIVSSIFYKKELAQLRSYLFAKR